MARILLVDDEESTRMLVGASLKKAGHRVLEADSAERALDAVRERTAPEVAVLDVRLPGMDGIELARQLRAEMGDDALPVIFLSAGVQEAEIERGREIGAIYLTKPFVSSALLSAIERVLPEEPSDW